MRDLFCFACQSSVRGLKFFKEMIFGFVSGHDFSRAVHGAKQMGFTGCGKTLSFAVVAVTFHR
jgi:hypothetical protein